MSALNAGPCSMPGCGKPAKARGLCSMHYARQHKAGARVATPSFAERYAAGIRYGGPAECWPWVKGQHVQGYGTLGRDGESVLTHRVAWELANGPIPDGMQVLHRCDNRPCCNPAHLFLGTNEENHEDKVAKGRQAKGEQVGASKLTEAAVAEMRERYEAGGISQAALAHEYGVSQGVVSMAVRGITWAHVA